MTKATGNDNDNEAIDIAALDARVGLGDAVHDCGWDGFILFEADEATGQVFSFFMTDEKLAELLAWRRGHGYLEAA